MLKNQSAPKSEARPEFLKALEEAKVRLAKPSTRQESEKLMREFYNPEKKKG